MYLGSCACAYVKRVLISVCFKLFLFLCCGRPHYHYACACAHVAEKFRPCNVQGMTALSAVFECQLCLDFCNRVWLALLVYRFSTCKQPPTCSREHKSPLTSQVVQQAGAYLRLQQSSMKRLRVFLLLPGWDASPSQGYSPALNIWVERVTVSVLPKNARSGDERTNHEATALNNA